MQLLVTIPYCTKDIQLAKKLADWMFELQPYYPGFSCLLVADHEVSQTDKLDLQNRLKRCFANVETMVVRVPAERQKWPDGPNVMFSSAARQIEEAYRMPWLWLEPDAVPLREGWLAEIGLEYLAQPKRCMGSMVAAENQPEMPPVHLSGVSVYPPDLWSGISNLIKNATKPFDILLAPYLVPRSSDTNRMQHFWGLPDAAPTFKDPVTPIDPKNTLSPQIVKPTAVLFHRCKDGSLIDILRQRKLNAATPSPTVESEEVPADKKPGRPRKPKVVETQ